MVFKLKNVLLIILLIFFSISTIGCGGKMQRMEENTNLLSGEIEEEKSENIYEIKLNKLTLEEIKSSYKKAISLTSDEIKGKDSINIILPSDTLYLKDTITFEGERKNSLPIKFVGNDTIISGGLPINRGGWSEYKDGIYYKHIGNGYRGSRTFTIDGELGTLARSREIKGWYDKTKREFYVKASEAGVEEISGTVEVSTLERWKNNYGIGISATNKNGVFTIKYNEESEQLFFVNSSFLDEYPMGYLQNNLAFLDEVNEWYYDYETGNIYYYPNDPSTINTSRFVLSNQEMLMDTDGLVEDVTFYGITFECSNYYSTSVYGYGEQQATYHTTIEGTKILPSMVWIKSNKTTIDKCVFRNCTQNALHIFSTISDVVVKNSKFLNVGGGAILVGSISQHTEDNITKNVVVTNNYIDGYGIQYGGAPGITTYYAKDVEVSHNTVTNGKYTGISMGWGWTADQSSFAHGGYKVLYNRVYNVMASNLYDGGCNYVLGSFANTLGEMINEIAYNYYYEDGGLAPIYLDEASTSYYVHDNALYADTNNSHKLGAIFMHNPLRGSSHQNSHTMTNNYVVGYNKIGNSTYNTHQLSESELLVLYKENKISIDNLILGQGVTVNEKIYNESGYKE